jgi:2-amino-4-hydroxy-6-hydroxymethyldihydropteridine diphosphokinase
MAAKVLVGIALGSNLGDRHAELDAGISFLRDLSLNRQLRESPRIETVPVDCPPGSQNFLNSVAEIEVDPELLPPRELMLRLQSFEQSRGRPAERETNAPRPLDLDIIYFGDRFIQEPGLIIPHPRAAQRNFVLQPLSDLRPDLVLPGQGKTVRELFLDTMPVGFAWKTPSVRGTVINDALRAKNHPRLDL